MLGYNGKKLISGTPVRKGTGQAGAIYGKLFSGKTARDASLLSSISDKDTFSSLWDAAVKTPHSMATTKDRPFKWEENGVTYSSDCLAFEKNMVSQSLHRPCRLTLSDLSIAVDHIRYIG